MEEHSNQDQKMLIKNSVLYRFLGISWVLFTLVPRDSKSSGTLRCSGLEVPYISYQPPSQSPLQPIVGKTGAHKFEVPCVPLFLSRGACYILLKAADPLPAFKHCLVLLQPADP
ncbi:unnamed protein product, partial [Laminaria digitata]